MYALPPPCPLPLPSLSCHGVATGWEDAHSSVLRQWRMVGPALATLHRMVGAINDDQDLPAAACSGSAQTPQPAAPVQAGLAAPTTGAGSSSGLAASGGSADAGCMDAQGNARGSEPEGMDRPGHLPATVMCELARQHGVRMGLMLGACASMLELVVAAGAAGAAGAATREAPHGDEQQDGYAQGASPAAAPSAVPTKGQNVSFPALRQGPGGISALDVLAFESSTDEDAAAADAALADSAEAEAVSAHVLRAFKQALGVAAASSAAGALDDAGRDVDQQAALEDEEVPLGDLEDGEAGLTSMSRDGASAAGAVCTAPPQSSTAGPDPTSPPGAAAFEGQAAAGPLPQTPEEEEADTSRMRSVIQQLQQAPAEGEDEGKAWSWLLRVHGFFACPGGAEAFERTNPHDASANLAGTLALCDAFLMHGALMGALSVPQRAALVARIELLPSALRAACIALPVHSRQRWLQWCLLAHVKRKGAWLRRLMGTQGGSGNGGGDGGSGSGSGAAARGGGSEASPAVETVLQQLADLYHGPLFLRVLQACCGAAIEQASSGSAAAGAANTCRAPGGSAGAALLDALPRAALQAWLAARQQLWALLQQRALPGTAALVAAGEQFGWSASDPASLLQLLARCVSAVPDAGSCTAGPAAEHPAQPPSEPAAAGAAGPLGASATGLAAAHAGPCTEVALSQLAFVHSVLSDPDLGGSSGGSGLALCSRGGGVASSSSSSAAGAEPVTAAGADATVGALAGAQGGTGGSAAAAAAAGAAAPCAAQGSKVKDSWDDESGSESESESEEGPRSDAGPEEGDEGKEAAAAGTVAGDGPAAAGGSSGLSLVAAGSALDWAGREPAGGASQKAFGGMRYSVLFHWKAAPLRELEPAFMTQVGNTSVSFLQCFIPGCVIHGCHKCAGELELSVQACMQMQI